VSNVPIYTAVSAASHYFLILYGVDQGGSILRNGRVIFSDTDTDLVLTILGELNRAAKAELS
jgi:hypothetical protein